MRRLESYVRRYGSDFGPVYYHLLQSHAAHAGVSARLRRKLETLKAKAAAKQAETLPLFPETGGVAETAEAAELVAIGA